MLTDSFSKVPLSMPQTLYTLSRPPFCVYGYHSLPSTNTTLKELAQTGASEGTVVTALHQTAGRGRMGRSFFSPSGTGLYMSFLLRPPFPADAACITTTAAAAAAQAMERICGVAPQIKWVNDVYVAGKKVCGILTEGITEINTISAIIVGVGVNLSPPAEGFPADIQGKAGTLFSAVPSDEIPQALMWEILRTFWAVRPELAKMPYLSYYEAHSMLTGRKVSFTKKGSLYSGTVLGIDHNCGLVVQYANGQTESLFTGEVQLLDFNEA